MFLTDRTFKREFGTDSVCEADFLTPSAGPLKKGKAKRTGVSPKSVSQLGKKELYQT
jgi:hypothetical protein